MGAVDCAQFGKAGRGGLGLVVLAGRLAGEAFRESRFVAGGSVVVDDTLG